MAPVSAAAVGEVAEFYFDENGDLVRKNMGKENGEEWTDPEKVVYADTTCYKSTLSASGGYFPMRLDAAFVASIPHGVRITVDCYDETGGASETPFRILYAQKNEDNSGAQAGRCNAVAVSSENGWTKYSVDIRDLTAHDLWGFHLAINNHKSEENTLYIKGVTVTKLPAAPTVAENEALVDLSSYPIYGVNITDHSKNDWTNMIDSGRMVPVDMDGLMYHRLQALNATNPSYFHVLLNESFFDGDTANLRVTMEYLDAGTGFVQLGYTTMDTSGDPKVIWGDDIVMENSGELREYSVDLENISKVTTGDNFHIRLGTWSTRKGFCEEPFYLKSIRIMKLQPETPAEETAEFYFDENGNLVRKNMGKENGEEWTDPEKVVYADTTCYKSTLSASGGYFPMRLDAAFVASIPHGVRITVDCYDETGGASETPFRILYAQKNDDNSGAQAGRCNAVAVSSENGWTKYSADIRDLTANDLWGFHLAICNEKNEKNTLYLRNVTVTKLGPKVVIPRRDASAEVMESGIVKTDGVSVYYSEGKRNEDGTETLTPVTEIGGYKCWQTSCGIQPLEAPTYISFLLDEGFVTQPNDVVKVDIEYYDIGRGFMQITYVDNVHNAPTGGVDSTIAGEIRASDSKKWKTKTLYISDMTETGVNIEYHLRLATYGWGGLAGSPGPMYIKSVKFSKPGTPDVETELDMTGMPDGLIFANATIPQVPLKFVNNTEDPQTISVTATLRDHNGTKLKDFAESLQIDAKGKSMFNPDLSSAASYGTYSLEVTVKNNEEVIKKATYRFSRVLSSGQPMSLVGACDHTLVGVGRNDYNKNLPIMNKAGISYLRADFPWYGVESEKGVYRIPDHWGDMLNVASENDVSILVLLDYGNSLYNDSEGKMNPLDPAWQQAFADYCVFTVRYCKQNYGITEFELWNEWNAGLGGVPQEYTGAAYYAPVVYAAAKAIRSTPEISDVKLLTSMSGVDTAWMGAALNYDDGSGTRLYDLVDGIAYHPYNYPKDPSNGYWTDSLDQMIALLDPNDPKELWITEVGWPNGATGVSSEMHGAYLVRMFTDFMQSKYKDYMQHVFLYDLQNDGTDAGNNEHNFGFIMDKGVTTKTWFQEESIDTPLAAKDNYVALSAMTAMLNGATHEEKLTMGEGITAHHFTRNGKDLIVAWAKTGTTEMISLNAGTGTVVLTDLYGNSKQLNKTDGKVNLSLSNLPVYIEMDGFDSNTVTESAFEMKKTSFISAPGSQLNVEVTRQNGYESFAGAYHLTLPSGWSATETEFVAGNGSDNFKIVIPVDCSNGRYTVNVDAIKGNGESLGSFSFVVEVTGTFLVNPDVVDGKYVLEVMVQNTDGTQELNGSVKLNMAPEEWLALNGTNEKTFTAKAGENVSVYFAVPENVSDRILYTVQVIAGIDGQETVTIDKQVSFQKAIRATTTMTMDGVLDDKEWENANIFALGENDWKSEKAWSGITASGMTKWDDEYLYVAITVDENVHRMTKLHSEIWNGDGVQFGFDPNRFFETTTGSQYNEIGIAKNTETNAVLTWKWGTSGMVDDINMVLVGGQYAVERLDGKTIYEMAIPWSVIAPNVDIQYCRRVGFSVVLNEDDGEGRIGWLEYMSGIGLDKNASLFGDLILTDAPVVKPTVKFGDVNGDGIADLEDAVLLYAHANGNELLDAEKLNAADVNGDGAVDLTDAVLLYAYANGTISALPADEK